MPIHSRKNLYRGVNAHLNSYLQNTRGQWKSFHSEHIIDLRKAVDLSLPPGYVALSEQSLQIEYALTTSAIIVPDMTIARQVPRTAPAPVTSALTPTVASIEMTVEQSMKELDEYDLSAVAIYKLTEAGELGKPCTLLELLSPANKPPHAAHEEYLYKRNQALRNGLRLVEIDYLHQTASLLNHVPSYPDRHPGSFPYAIVVSDPRPSTHEGKTFVFGFHADDPIPVVSIPLEGADTFVLDFGRVYNTTYEARQYHVLIVDYARLPLHFESYDALDQGRIQARMSMIREEHAPS
jgi:hypothetical protein